MRKRIGAFFLSLILIVLLAFSIPLSAFAASCDTSKDEVEYYVIPYVIEKGDTIAHIYWLWGLRFENYAEDIKSLNSVDNLDLLYVDAVYLLPTTASNLKTDTYTTVMAHIMRSGETAYDVFASYGVDYNSHIERLQRYNGGRDLTRIEAGEKLLIPLI